MNQHFTRMGLTGLPKRFDGEDGSYAGSEDEKYGVGDAYTYTGSDYYTPPSWAMPETNEPAVAPALDQSAEETRRLGLDLTPGLINPYAVGAKPGESVVGSSAISNDAQAKMDTIKAENSDIWTQLTKLPGKVLDSYLQKKTNKDGTLDLFGIGKDLLAGGAAIKAYSDAQKPSPKTGYQGGIPKYTAVRQMTPTPAGYRPGQGGHNYFSGTTFMAKGGETGHHGTYLQGDTDGMADKIPGTIDGVQPARLAHGEFVIPADVVSHLGNGNSDAGAQQLYKMMDRIRQARTGNKEQGKRIDPDKFMPGGLAHAAQYAEGGVARFDGTGGSAVPTGTIGTEQGLSDWAGNYATDILGKGQALVNQEMANPSFYQGPLTAGDSALQSKAYGAAGNLSTPASIGAAATTAGNAATQLGGLSYKPGDIAPFMSPYTQNVTDVVNREAQRNADIASTQRHAGAVGAGAFGGSRQAIGDAEADRNLAMLKSANTAKGLQDAYTAAQNASQFGATYGLNALQGAASAAGTQGSLGATQNAAGLANLQAQLTAGNQQQATEQAGLTADQAMFEKQKEDPFQMLNYQKSLLSGLPIQATSYNINTDPWALAANAITGTQTLVK